jgi:hypothetical protein
VDLKVNSGAKRGGQLDKGHKSYEESKNIVHFHLELHVSNVEEGSVTDPDKKHRAKVVVASNQIKEMAPPKEETST